MQKHSKSGGGRFQSRTFKNEDIKAPRILVMGSDGTNLGVMPRLKALEMAQEQNVDLVQLSYNMDEQISTAKLVDYGKFMYSKKKTEQEKKKHQNAKEQKELKFGYTIGDNDLDLKIKKAMEFLKNGHIVRISVVLKGREKVYKKLALQKVKHVEMSLEQVSKSQSIKEEQNGYSLNLFPKGKHA